MTTSHRASSDVGDPATGNSPESTSSTDIVTSTTDEPSNTPAETAHATTSYTTVSPTTTAGTTTNASGHLSDGAVAGVSVGTSVAFVALLGVAFFLLHRRRHAKRMPSYRDNMREEFNEKEPKQDSQPPAASGDGADVFAAFGGRANSFETPKAHQTVTPSAPRYFPDRQDNVSPLTSPTSPARVSYVSPITPQFMSSIHPSEPSGNRDTISSRAPSVPVELDSSRLFYELDSADTARSNMFELPAPTPPMTPQTALGLGHEAKSDHSEALMPGSFPNMVKDAQRQKFTRVQSGDAALVDIGARSQSSRPGSFDQPTHLRATMNATADDVKSNRHVNSWAHL
ncbi:hypothetical protein E8E14_007541 [Neopestalotiopsis sp. 37M]|nr:hypothetical protein E8E14_007541 [Neopestalotiopsis sp. 37M]